MMSGLTKGCFRRWVSTRRSVLDDESAHEGAFRIANLPQQKRAAPLKPGNLSRFGRGKCGSNAGRINKSVDWLPQFKYANVFHMVGVGEHVDGLNLGKPVAMFDQILDIACLRVGAAGDVYDALWRQAAGRAKKLLV